MFNSKKVICVFVMDERFRLILKAISLERNNRKAWRPGAGDNPSGANPKTTYQRAGTLSAAKPPFDGNQSW